MKKLWLSNSRKRAALFFGFFLALLLLSCAQAPQKKPASSPRPKECWLLQPLVYRLRHSAQLEYQGRQEMLEGFMELDRQNERAHLIIFNSLGLTLLNLEIEAGDYKLSKSSTTDEKKKHSDRREQQFAQIVATAVQHIFFSLTNREKEYQRNKPKALAEFGGNPPELISISEQLAKPTWVATYHNYQKFTAGWLPERITLKSYKPQFNLTLWLHKAEIVTEIPR